MKIQESKGEVNISDPREKTQEEVQAEFLGHIWLLLDYWIKQKKDPRKQMSGFAFSILSMIDGCTIDLPAFALIPNPHPDDKEYHRAQGEDWYPPFEPKESVSDIAGGLHEVFYDHDPQRKI